MTNNEFKQAQARLGLSNSQMAAVLRVSIKTVETWRSGKRSVPGPVRVLLAVCQKFPAVLAWLREQ